MPVQVLSNKYIDRRKLRELLNTLYKPSQFKVEVSSQQSLRLQAV